MLTEPLIDSPLDLPELLVPTLRVGMPPRRFASWVAVPNAERPEPAFPRGAWERENLGGAYSPPYQGGVGGG